MSLFSETVRSIQPQDPTWRARAHARLADLTMPHWALGRLMDLAEDLAGMTRSMTPPVQRKAVVVMAGDHGVVAEGVSAYPAEVTAQMVHNFVRGGAAVNALAGLAGARVVVVDMGVAADTGHLAREGRIVARRVAPGTGNIARGPAMTAGQARQAVETGIALAGELAPEIDLLAAGEMGIGNTTASAAVLAALTGCPPEEATGRGTGIDDRQLRHKVTVVRRALEVNAPERGDALDVLAKVGGFEIGGIAGLILGAAARQKPVLVDGLISTAGALVAGALAPHSADYMIASHCSAERGHRVALGHLGKAPLLDLGLRLGEGTGAVLAMHLVEAAARVLADVATFGEAAVSTARV